MLVCSIFSTLQIAERAVFIAGIDALYILFFIDSIVYFTSTFLVVPSAILTMLMPFDGLPMRVPERV